MFDIHRNRYDLVKNLGSCGVAVVFAPGHPSREVLVSLTDGHNSVVCVNIASCKIGSTLRGHSHPARSLGFQREGGNLTITASKDSCILWDHRSWKRVRTLTAANISGSSGGDSSNADAIGVVGQAGFFGPGDSYKSILQIIRKKYLTVCILHTISFSVLCDLGGQSELICILYGHSIIVWEAITLSLKAKLSPPTTETEVGGNGWGLDYGSRSQLVCFDVSGDGRTVAAGEVIQYNTTPAIR